MIIANKLGRVPKNGNYSTLSDKPKNGDYSTPSDKPKDDSEGGGFNVFDSVFSFLDKGTKVIEQINKISENKNTKELLEQKNQQALLDKAQEEIDRSNGDDNSKLLMYGGIGLGVVLVGGLIIYAVSSSKQKK